MAQAKNLRVQKRDGTIVDFDEAKIRVAIAKAFSAVNEKKLEFIDKVKDKVIASLSENNVYNIEHLQDLVERSLVELNLFDVSKAYILYRRQHEDLRKIGFILSSNDIVDNYLNVDDWRVKENSNMSYSIQGLNNHVASIVTSNYWLNKIYPVEIRDAHSNGDFHLHDLGMLSVYCCGWDLKDLLLRGFGGVTAKIESCPAKRFRTALGQIVNFFYTMQGEAAGAQAFANFDTLLAPFVSYDGLTQKEVKQAMQEFIYNMNVPTRVGFQTPFTNVTMDLVVPNNMKDDPVVVGGEYKDKTYKEFQKEMDMINVAFAEVMMSGDAKGRIFTFPIPTYNVTKDFDWENKVLEPVWQMTAKYGIPYFSNFVNSDMSPDDARSMCCRLRLDKRELVKRGGGLFGSNPLTGSIGVVTINLPRLGFLSESKQELFDRLKKQMILAKESLEIKRKVLEQYTLLGLYPY
ncbi:MAG: ribonucleoside triphosphate reductase, partial [Candidatus Woesearchaeota archaeon]